MGEARVKEIDPQVLIAAVVKSVEKEIKDWSPGILGRPTRFFDSGSYALNWAMSGLPISGGYPGGRVIDLHGDPSTGKSLLIYYAMAYATRNGGYAVLDDTESCYMDVYGEKLGVDNQRLILLNSVTVEEHYDAIRALRKELRAKLGSEPPIVLAVDSVAQLTTEHELEKGFEKEDYGRKAKLIKKGMRLLRPEMVQDEGTIYLVANHVIANIGDMYNPTTTPGGGGIPFQSSIRVELQFRGKARVKDSAPPFGVDSLARVVKSKITEPFRECRIRIHFKEGVQREHDLFEVAKASGVIEQRTKNGWYNFVGADEGERGFQRKTFYDSFMQEALDRMEVLGKPSEEPSKTQ